MDDLFEHLRTLTIKDICQSLNLPVKIEAGYNDCPFCQRPGKFRVESSRYKCFHPACGKRGDGISFLVDLNFASDRADACKTLSGILGITSQKDWTNRLRTMNAAFEAYCKTDKSRAIEVLNSRGIDKALSQVSYGYAPDCNTLQTSGFSIQDLESCRLVHKGSDHREFFRDRIIFPIYSEKGKLVHMQGRACDPSANIRWLSTSSPSVVKPISCYLYNSMVIHYEQKGVFLCEGISDSLSLIELGLPVVGCFGVNIDLLRHSANLKSTKNLVVIIDADRYEIGTEKQGDYKSWNAMINSLIDLAINLPEMEIFVMMVPEEIGKDVNDWLMSGAKKEDVLNRLNTNSQKLEDFAFDLYSKTSFSFQDLVRLLKSRKSDHAVDRLNDLIKGETTTPGEFILNNL